MIKNLHIENYALIEHLDIDMHSGFSVITGETGAGKSIILGAIGLLLGQRADSKSIKTGAKRCVVEATFDISKYGFDSFFVDNELDFDGNECIIRRELTAAGKSRAFINDTPTQLATLKELGDKLIDVHSQHKNLLLGKEDFQLNVLDTIIHNEDLLDKYAKEYAEYQHLQKQLKQAREDAARSHDDEDFLRFQLTQLADANLREGEQEELEEEAEKLSHAEDIKQALFTAQGYIAAEEGMSDNALQQIKQSISALRSISDMIKAAGDLADRLDSCYIEIKDVADEIESQCESTEFNPERLDFVNERLNTIYSLQHKHHKDTVDELIQLRDSLEQKLLFIDNSDEHIVMLENKCDEQYKATLALAEKISKQRKKAALSVEKEMTERLIPLGMPNVRFHVECAQEAETCKKLSPSGIDTVKFLFSANKNSALQDISQVASGGEIARVMLSLKALIAGAVKLPTIIFDEIDTGVSGSIAEKMARIMKEMGDKDRQVISITHLPQIAALGTSHYKVYKEDSEDATLSHITELTHEQRIEEIAHMLSGEVLTDAALENAKMLLS